jgi:hypothetical protein
MTSASFLNAVQNKTLNSKSSYPPRDGLGSADPKETAAMWQANASLREAEFDHFANARQAASDALTLGLVRGTGPSRKPAKQRKFVISVRETGRIASSCCVLFSHLSNGDYHGRCSQRLYKSRMIGIYRAQLVDDGGIMLFGLVGKVLHSIGRNGSGLLRGDCAASGKARNQAR